MDLTVFFCLSCQLFAVSEYIDGSLKRKRMRFLFWNLGKA